MVAAGMALWVAGIEARLVYLQIVVRDSLRGEGGAPAESHDQDAGQAG